MAASILSVVAWLLQLAVFAVLAPALLAAHRIGFARAAGQPAPRATGLLHEATRLWRGTSFRIEGASAVAPAAPLLAATLALTAMAIVPGFCRGLPTAPLADPVTLVALLLAAEVVPLLGALAVGTSATGQAATAAAIELSGGFAALLLVAFAALAMGGLDPGIADATPTSKAALLAAAVVAMARAAEALRGSPGLLDEAGGPDLALLRWAAAARAAVLLTFARDLVLPWLWPAALPSTLFDALPDAAALPRWPLALLFWVATLLLAAAALGALAARLVPMPPERRGWALVAVGAGVLAVALLGQAAP